MTRTVVCFGDSLTHGTCAMAGPDDVRRFGPRERWTGVLAERLSPEWHVIEEGHPGRTTLHSDPIEGAHKNGLQGLRIALETHRPIDLVVIMLGMNDFKPRFSVEARDIALSVGKLAVEVQASPAGPLQGAPDVLVVAPPVAQECGWLGPHFKGAEAKSQALASELEAEMARWSVPFLDAGQVVGVDPIDGIHLALEAQAPLAPAIADMIEAHFPAA